MSVASQVNAEQSTSGGIAEWAGPVYKAACFDAVQASTPLSSPLVRLVTQFLRKERMVDLPDFEQAYGKKKVVELLEDKPDQVVVPFGIEKLLQTDLDQLFSDPKTLQMFAGKTKLTEVASLFFKIQGLTLNVTAESCIPCMQFHDFSQATLRDFGANREASNQWIIQLDEPIDIGRDPEKQNAVVPKGGQVCPFVDRAHCMFASALPVVNLPISETATLCSDQVDDLNVIVDYRPSQEKNKKSEILAAYSTRRFNFVSGIQWKMPAIVAPHERPVEQMDDKRAAGA